jgi:glycosyltransferase involved in cell wall biosynthesis
VGIDRKLRVVWVSPALPHPQAAGGWAHEYELLSGLAERHTLHVVSADLDTPLDPAALTDRGIGFTRVAWKPYPHPTRRWRIAANMITARPNMILWLRRDRERQIARVLGEVCGSFRPDLVHITLGELAPLISVVRQPVALLLFDSLTREIEGRLARERLPRRRAQLTVERARTRHYERHWYSQAAALACVSTVDAAWFKHLLGRPVEVIENPIGDGFFDPPVGPRSDNIVTFVGTLNHHPNTDAIEWLAREIWPKVIASRPDAELRVVGRSDSEGRLAAHLRKIIEGAGGRLFVDVPDVRPYYWEAAVVVANIRLGAGMRNKVIHAMACHAPVVATPAAVEGIEEDAIRCAVVADSADDLAQAIVDTLNDRAGAAERAERAATEMLSLHTPRVAERLEQWWQRALD